ncbi:MAG: hypothetical protein LBI30_00660, partial [Holosporales bacterium]|nr:hypothetical protein [Holosporales bacterium]
PTTTRPLYYRRLPTNLSPQPVSSHGCITDAEHNLDERPVGGDNGNCSQLSVSELCVSKHIYVMWSNS